MSKLTLMRNVISKKRPIHVTFFVTGHCNAKCRMCFYWKAAGKDELTLEEIRKIAGNYRHKLLWLALTGGEPFMRDDLLDIAEAFYKSSEPSYITIPTNGLLTERIVKMASDIADRCPKSSIRIKLSLDGIGGVHDDIRGVPGAYERLLKTYDELMKLTKKNLSIGLTITFSSFNKDTIKDTLDYVLNSGRFQNPIPPSVNYVRGNTREEGAKQIGAEEFERTIKSLSEAIAEKYKNRSLATKLLIADEYFGKELTAGIISRNRMPIPCYAGLSSIVITEEGAVYPCEILTTKMGSLRESNYSIDNIMKNNGVRKFIKDGKCACTHECNMFTNTLLNARLYPRILKKYRQMFR